MCRELFGVQQTVSQCSPNILRSSPSWVFTTCSCARSSDRPLERPEYKEGPARQLHEEDNLPRTSKRQATSATATSAETSTSRGTLDELAERLGNFHDSGRALASCVQKHDVSSKTDQSMIEAAKCMFHKLLGEASDDLERVTPLSRENLNSCPEALTNKLRSRFEVPNEKSV